MPPTLFTSIANKDDLFKILSNNKDKVIVKFTATWCGPCKKIESTVNEFINTLPDTVSFYNIDIDDNIEIYGFLKSKKMVSGIPAILVWNKGSVNYIPDKVHLGGDISALEQFFKTI
jgi:thioredoxin 1